MENNIFIFCFSKPGWISKLTKTIVNRLGRRFFKFYFFSFYMFQICVHHCNGDLICSTYLQANNKLWETCSGFLWVSETDRLGQREKLHKRKNGVIYKYARFYYGSIQTASCTNKKHNLERAFRIFYKSFTCN